MNEKQIHKLVIGCDLQEKHISMIAEMFGNVHIRVAQDEEDQKAIISDANILLTRVIPQDPTLSPELKWVQFIWEGVDRMTDEFRESSIVLTNAGGAHSIHMAEHVFTYILNFNRKTRLYEQYQKNGEWLGWNDQPRLQRLSGSTIGIIGYGRIGRAIAKIATGFQMKVLALKKDPSKKSDDNYNEGACCDPEGEIPEMIFSPGNMKEMLSRSDHVVMTLPLTNETRGSFGYSEFASMKDDAFFVNVGRGEVIIESDLIRALQEGMIAGAGLDVFSEEPLPKESPLWSMENVFITPHSSVGGDPSDEQVVGLFMDNLDRFLKGKKMLNVIDKRKGY